MRTKMLRRGSLLLALIFCLLIAAVPIFAEGEQRVYDYAELFSAEEEAELEIYIDKLRAEYPFDFVVLTSDDTEGKETLAYADDFYDREDLAFGYGETYDGILYFIDMENRVPAVSTCGEMIGFIDDERLDILLDHVYNDLVEGEFAQSVVTFLELAESFITGGLPADQYYYDQETGNEVIIEGNHYYDPVTGEIYQQNDVEILRYRSLSPGELILGIVIGLIVLLIMQLVIRRKYNMKGSNYSYNRAVNSFMNITDRQDQYIHTTETRHRIQSSSHHGGGPRMGGGTGVRMGSSGRSHGGGVGRRF